MSYDIFFFNTDEDYNRGRLRYYASLSSVATSAVSETLLVVTTVPSFKNNQNIVCIWIGLDGIVRYIYKKEKGCWDTLSN